MVFYPIVCNLSDCRSETVLYYPRTECFDYAIDSHLVYSIILPAGCSMSQQYPHPIMSLPLDGLTWDIGYK